MPRILLLAAGVIAVLAAGPGSPTTNNVAAQSKCVPATVPVPAGWSLLAARVAVYLPAAATSTWDGTQYVTGVSVAGSIFGLGEWVFLTKRAAVEIDAQCPDMFASGVLQPSRWSLLGNPTATPMRLLGPDEVWVYDPVEGYQQTHVLAPGQGAWVISASLVSVAFQRVSD